MANVVYLTEEGLQKLKDDLDALLAERPVISQQIADARDKGDLSENAEYDAAKEAQGMLEMKIAKLQDTIRNARIIDESKLDTSTVQLLNTIRLKNLKTGKDVTYTIVPESEADIKAGRISVGTPIAKGLIGKKKGDVVNINIPAGAINFEILEITV